jgi:hypothetical protein
MTLTRILAARPSQVLTSSPAPGGPAGRYLTSPGAFTARLARVLVAILQHFGPVAGPVLAVALAGSWRAGRGCTGASMPPSPLAPAPSRCWPRRRPTRTAARRCGGT